MKSYTLLAAATASSYVYLSSTSSNLPKMVGYSWEPCLCQVKVRAARGRGLRTATKELQLNSQMFVLGFGAENRPAVFSSPDSV